MVKRLKIVLIHITTVPTARPNYTEQNENIMGCFMCTSRSHLTKDCTIHKILQKRLIKAYRRENNEVVLL